jgi:pyridoxine 4-dehydrogenase
VTTARHPGGTFPLGGDMPVARLGFGAMQLAGPGVWGPPPQPAAAVQVLRTAVELGVDHIDTSDYYGPHVVNDLIRQALWPYPAGLRIATKVGYRRGAGGSWQVADSAGDLKRAVYDNLTRLGADALDLVYLRAASPSEPDGSGLQARFGVLARMQERGLIRHLGVSNVGAAQLAAARQVAEVAAVQNRYEPGDLAEEDLADTCARLGIAYVPFTPLALLYGPLRRWIGAVAAARNISPPQVALAWLLRRGPNVLAIPGTSSVAHLRQNLAAADLDLPAGAAVP